MIRSILLSFLLLVGWVVAGQTVKGIRLELPAEPTPAEQTAQTELRHYLERVVLKTLNVDGVTVTEIQLQTLPELAEEAWNIHSQGDRITISGGGSRGVLYGVYHFLEDQLGIHWWTPNEESVPAPANIRLPALRLAGAPGLLYRDIWRTDEFPDQGRFCARNRVNRDGDTEIAARYGGSFAYGSPYHSHTFDLYFPKEQYFAAHPEYYSWRDGERRAGQYQGQLCLTNPEVRKLTIRKLRDYIEADRRQAEEKQLPPPRLYDLSMNDNWNACRCPECNAEAERYGDSGVLLRFLNAVAEEVVPDYPDIYLTTLGYFYHEPVPKNGVMAHPRVIVKLCDTTSSQAVGILHPVNAGFKQLVEDWKEVTDNLFIWDYGINYMQPVLPYPGEMTEGELFRFYREHRVKGVFWQHDEAPVAEFYPMKIWLTAKLMENPEADFDALRTTFLEGYFGAAASDVGRFRELLAEAANRNQAKVDCMAGTDAYLFIDVDTLVECHRRMDQAQVRVAGEPEKLARVIQARAGLDALTAQWLRHYHEAWQRKYQEPLPVDRQALTARLREWGADRGLDANPARRKEMAGQYANYAETMPASYVPPARFQGSRYRDFTAETLSVIADPGIRLVADPAAENGVALQMNLQQNADGLFGLPFEFGIYDPSKGRHVEKIEWDSAPLERTYQWYPIGGFQTLSRSTFVYLSRSWRIQARLTDLGDATPEMQGWIRLRFSGNAFYPDSREDSFIWIDRIVLVEK